MPRRLSILAAALMGLTVSHVALAELYISPALRSTVSYDAKENPAPVATPAKPAETLVIKASELASQGEKAGVITGKSTVHGDFEINKSGSLFGKNVPLFVALENLLPPGSSHQVVLQPGIENMPVSWNGATDYRHAFKQIEANHKLSIVINDEHRRIGVARSAQLAEQISNRGQDVWVLQDNSSLRTNLEAWAKKANWRLDWGSTQIDYPVDHGATLIGKFDGAGGVVDRVLSSTRGRETPLTAVFYKGNNVVLVTEAGYKPEEPVSPIAYDDAY